MSFAQANVIWALSRLRPYQARVRRIRHKSTRRNVRGAVPALLLAKEIVVVRVRGALVSKDCLLVDRRGCSRCTYGRAR